MDEVSLLTGLLKKYSPTGQEQGAVDFLVDWMNQAGYRAFADPAGNAVGIRGDGPRSVMLLGHIDTVPGYIEVEQKEDVLFGRGAVDAKGPLASFAAAGSRVEVPSGWQVVVVGATAEEGDSHGAMYIRDHYHPEAVIIGEPSKWDRITLGFKGSMWARYEVEVPMAHTASNQASACELAVAFWNALAGWCAEQTPGDVSVFNQLTPTLREMTSETTGFLQKAALRIGVRLPPGIGSGAVMAAMEERRGNGRLTFEEPVEAYRADKNTDLVRAFLNGVRQAGGKPSFSVKTGTSDMNIVAPAWNVPAVAYGPGDSAFDHTPEEQTSVAEYRLGVQVLANTLAHLMAHS